MELRKDYVLDRWVIVATERSKRPDDFKNAKAKKNVYKKGEKKNCFFCPGNEKTTPPEIGRVEKDGKWLIRWFPNKYAAVEPKGDSSIKCHNNFFTFSDAYGIAEVIAETPEHRKNFWDLEEWHIKEVLKVYAKRIEELSKINNIRYVQVFKNEGEEAGSSIKHTHTQIIATNIVPLWIREEVEATKSCGFCPYCKIIDIEKGSYRRVFESDEFVSFTPYASKYPFEIWIFPKQHIRNITEMNENQLEQLAKMLNQILIKLKELNAQYNMCLHYAPQGEDLHFHIEITPRLTKWAGFEFFGTVINVVSPESAAEFYRNEPDKK